MTPAPIDNRNITEDWIYDLFEEWWENTTTHLINSLNRSISGPFENTLLHVDWKYGLNEIVFTFIPNDLNLSSGRKAMSKLKQIIEEIETCNNIVIDIAEGFLKIKCFMYFKD